MYIVLKYNAIINKKYVSDLIASLRINSVTNNHQNMNLSPIKTLIKIGNYTI